MIILVLQIFISLVLVAGAVALFVFTVRARTFDHADRLALSPLDDDGAQPAPRSSAAAIETAPWRSPAAIESAPRSPAAAIESAPRSPAALVEKE